MLALLPRSLPHAAFPLLLLLRALSEPCLSCIKFCHRCRCRCCSRLCCSSFRPPPMLPELYTSCAQPKPQTLNPTLLNPTPATACTTLPSHKLRSMPLFVSDMMMHFPRPPTPPNSTPALHCRHRSPVKRDTSRIAHSACNPIFLFTDDNLQ